jgi:hypothetical protein
MGPPSLATRAGTPRKPPSSAWHRVPRKIPGLADGATATGAIRLRPATRPGSSCRSSPVRAGSSPIGLRWLHAGESVILYGPVGVGRPTSPRRPATWPSAAGAETPFPQNQPGAGPLAGGHADLTWDKRLRELTRPAVLILDDFGMRELSAA